MILSIVIINYRQADIIKRMLENVVVKSDDFEIIVVDDCSSDHNLDDLQKFMSINFNHSTVVRAQNHSFTGGARNIGVSTARGEWIWFIDGDDDIVPGAIERVIDSVKKSNDVDCLVLDYNIESNGAREPVSFHNCRPADRLKIWNVGIMAWHKVIRKSVFVEFRCASFEDNDWWIRQCINIISRRRVKDVYETVDGGPCYTYRKFAPGALTTNLQRFSYAQDRESAVNAIMIHPETSLAVRDILIMLSELVSLSQSLIDSKMPTAFIQDYKFVLKYWLERIAQIGSEK